MSWSTRPALAPGQYPRGEEMEAILDRIEATPLFAYKTADTNIISDAILDNDADLRIVCEPNARYWVRARLLYSAGAAADFSFKMVETTSTAPVSGGFDVSGQFQGTAVLDTHSGALGTVFDMEGISADKAANVEGIFFTGADSATLVVAWAQRVSTASTIALLHNSYLMMMKVS